MKNYSLRIRPQYLQGVPDGRKTIEVRVRSTTSTRIRW
jgi:ASC-1-like (ASCH) protein